MKLMTTSYNIISLIDPRIISGLIQSDGSFSVSIVKSKSKLGFVLRPQFTISLMTSSLSLLKAIKIYFGVGYIYLYRGHVQYLVSSFEELWHVIIPHFINYPMFGCKHLVFVKFVTILTYLFPYQNKVKPHLVLMKIIVLMIGMNSGASKADPMKWLGTLPFPIVPNFSVSLVTEYVRPLSVITAYFLVGLIEGDGSFYFSMRGTGKLRFGFSITTHIGELDLMYAVQRYLGFGQIKLETTWCRFETESISDLLRVMVPLVDGIPLLGSKSDKFLAFRRVLTMYKNKEHMSPEGRKEIEHLLSSRNPLDEIM